jgi:glucosamine--fructose-6-phosphate aminotransferase (isomerizing)
MCGIFGHYIFNGYITRKQILDILFCGLHRLEYRGYDSAGISIQVDDHTECSHSSAPIIIKAKGNISALESLTEKYISSQNIDVDVVFNNHVGTKADPDERHSCCANYRTFDCHTLTG